MVTMSDPSVLGLATCPDSGHCDGRKIRIYVFLSKNLFYNLFFFFLPKTLIKHPGNHEKPIHDLKKQPQKPNSTGNKKSIRAHICFFIKF